MLLRRISYRIALQFTAFVFGLLVINGALFLAVDIVNAGRLAHLRLMNHASGFTQQHSEVAPEGLGAFLPPMLRERTRIADPEGNSVYAGELFSDVPFSSAPEFSSARIHGEEYTIFTAPILQDEHVVGYMQIADTARIPRRDLPERVLLFLVLSAAVSALTFFVGLYFARKSLAPAEETMERLAQFTQDASHELRTPLAVLNSSLDVALKSKNYKEGIESAKDDVKQISVLVERLLELTRLDSFALDCTRVDLSQMLTEAAEKFSHLAKEKSIRLESDIAPGISIQADATLLRQITTNLLSNAIKFNHSGGTVIVRLTKKAFTITDTGIGISPEDLPHLFDRFYQADGSRSRGGLGLGLALVKRIVDLHDWKIGVESEEGQGTTFKVTFS